MATATGSTKSATYQSNARQAETNTKKYLKCTYCHKEGHLKESCFKLIGYPPHGRGNGKFSNAQGFRSHPQAIQVSGVLGAIPSSSSGVSSLNVNSSVQSTTNNSSSQTSIEQLQHQMTQLMNIIMNNKAGNSTPEDHIGQRVGLHVVLQSYMFKFFMDY